MAGVKTTDLAESETLDEVLGNVLVGGERRTRRQPISDLAAQLAASGPISDAIDGAADGLVQFKTLAQLNGTPGTRAGQPGEVTDDGANTGKYSWSGSAWVRIGDIIDPAALQAGIDAEAAARAAGDNAEAVARAAADTALGVRGSAGISIHSVNVIDGSLGALAENAWSVRWTTCRAIIGNVSATIADVTQILASNELLYIDVESGGSPYPVTKAAISAPLRADFRDGKKLLLLLNWGGGLLVGPMADTLRTVVAQPLLDSLAQEIDLVYVGRANLKVRSIDPKGRLVDGIDLSTGLSLVGTPANSDLSLMTVTRSAGNLYIHIPQADGTYVRKRMSRLTNVGQRSDVWQVYGIDHATLIGGVSSVIQPICDTGQVEIALARVGDDPTFQIGGNAHGNDELLADPIMLVDGVAVDITTGTEPIACRRLEISQRSQLLSPDDASNVAKRYTSWLFEDGWLYLTNHVVFEAEVSFRIMYLAMLSALRLDGATQITHSGIRSPLNYPVEDLSGDHVAVYGDAARLKAWGDTYSAEVELLEGWDDANRESWFSSGNNRNKLYFSSIGVDRPGFVRSYTTTIGEVMRVRSRMRVGVI